MKRVRETALLMIMLFALMPVSVFAQLSPLSDGAGYLNVSQKEEIESLLNYVNENCEIHMEIITETSMSESNVKDSAIAAVKRNGYNSGGAKGGITLYVAKEQRQYQLLTRGKAKELTIDELKLIEGEVVEALGNDDYYRAFSSFVNTGVDVITKMIIDESVSNTKTRAESGWLSEYSDTLIIIAVGTLILPLVMACIMTKKKSDQMYTARSQEKADSYMKSGSIKMTVMQDIYLYSNTVKRAKPKPQNTNSFGGHSNKSSGGFGGIGGSF